jgi:hypothetical protein
MAAVGWRNARSTTALRIQGTVIGLATAMLAVLLHLIAAQLRGG